MWGSSPLARGTRCDFVFSEANDGLIPARAGNTLFLSPQGLEGRAHPRSRGEHQSQPHQLGGVPGSSPLARGTLHEHCDCIVVPGLIPARAGNTVNCLALSLIHEAHPRSRGEHLFSASLTPQVPGSSPLARGTLKLTGLSLKRGGLIPARAGNTDSISFRFGL